MIFHERVPGRLRIIGILLAIIVVLGIATLVVGCSLGRDDRTSVVVGGANFTESILMGEIAAQLIEHYHPDVKVERKFGLGGGVIMYEAVKAKEIDIGLGYTATGILVIRNSLNLDQELADRVGVQLEEAFVRDKGVAVALDRYFETLTDPDTVYSIVQKVFEEDWGVRWLQPFGFNNTFSITIRQDLANRLGVKTISDLKPHASDLILAGSESFLERDDAYPKVVQTYGFEFKETIAMAVPLLYVAIDEGKVDAIDAWTTDGRIDKLNLVNLIDDKYAFLPYYATYMTNTDIFNRIEGLEETLRLLDGNISEEVIRRMNFRVDDGDEEIEDVARNFLESNGFF